MQDNQDTPVGKERKENLLLEELESKELRFVTWVKVFRINPEFRILRLTIHRKSASKC